MSVQNEGLRPWETVTEAERARLLRARKSSGSKLAALLPAWLKSHMAASKMPAPFKPDFSVVLPSLKTPQTDPRIGYYFPGGQVAKMRVSRGANLFSRPTKDVGMRATDSVSEYVAAFCKLNNLT